AEPRAPQAGPSEVPTPAPLVKTDPPSLDRQPVQIPLQVVSQVARAGIALARLFFQAFEADCFEVARDLGPQRARGYCLIGSDQSERLYRGAAKKGRTARKRLVQDCLEGVDVRGGADLLGRSPRLPGSHEAGGTEHLAGERMPCAGIDELGEAEIADLENAFLRQEDVAGLQIAMNDPGLVGGVHGTAKGLDPVRGLAGRDGSSGQ